jgi:hypothetical protein
LPVILRTTVRFELKRLDNDGRYETAITRDDAGRFIMRGVAHTFAIPHDLAHFAVEKALGIKEGFWGTIAAGAVFPTMTHIGGRRRPKASERSRALLKANARALVEAEVLVRIFSDTIENGHPESSAVLLARLQDRLPRPGQALRQISQANIAAVYSAYNSLRRAWNETPVGASLTYVW